MLCLGLTACNFTEEVYLQPDGSGSVAFSMDASALMALAADADSPPEEPVDTVMYFSDMLREKQDSISALPLAEQQRLARLEPYRLHMTMEPEAERFTFSLERDFTDISEVGDSFNAFQEAGALNPDNGDSPMGAATELQQSTAVDFSFASGRFKRSGRIVDADLHQQRLDSLEGAAAFLGGATYTLKIHFPSKVRSSTASDATLSLDGKTLVREVDLLEYLRDPTLLDMEVELEK